jgi:hypothetical protein
LASLRVRALATTVYDRKEFGRPWKDVDGNGCDTRNDILRRDLKNVVFEAGSTCIVAKGTLDDPYTGHSIFFVFGKKTSSAVQIDHVVALKNAWRTGAARWTSERRLLFANDPTVLLAVGRSANAAKQDKDASQWLPPNESYECTYVTGQIRIKIKYKLWATKAEHDEMAEVLGNCT